MINPRLLRQTHTYRWRLLLSVGLGGLSAFCIVGQAYLLSLIIHRAFLDGIPLANQRPQLFYLLLVISFRGLVIFMQKGVAQHTAIVIKSGLRQTLLSRVVSLGPSYAYRASTGELINTVVEGIESLEVYFGQYLPQILLAVLIPLTILLWVLPLDLLTAIIFLLTAPLIPLFMYLIGKTVEQLTQHQWRLLSRLSANFLDVLQGLTTLKTLGQSRSQKARVERSSRQYADVTLSVLRVTFLSALALEMLATLSTALVAVQVGLRLLNGNFVFQEALFILVVAPEFYQPLRALGAKFHAGMRGVTAADGIFAILDTPTQVLQAGAGDGRGFPAAPADIFFRQVTFRYPEEKQPVLHNISFVLQAGQITALVGASGAGKTTLTRLLLRFYQPDLGQICWGSRPITDWDLKVWHKQIAWVPQNPYLLNASIAENIRLGKWDANQAEVEYASHQAALHDFVLTLPLGYQTVIGEAGARLSGGQSQRIALARAFLKDSPVLILDEPAANLDPDKETTLVDTIEKLTRNRTVLLIAHRISSLRDADQIVMLGDGRIIESGSPTELLECPGQYARMFEAYGRK